MQLNSGYIIDELVKFYDTNHIPKAIKKLAKALDYSDRSIRRMLYYGIYSKELLIEVAVYLQLDPSQVFIK